MSTVPDGTPPVKASMAIAAELRGRIARGDLRPGDPLPSENELTEELGFSRPTIREALRILEHDGLIEVKRGVHGGPQVRVPSIDRVAEPMGVLLQITDVPVTDVWAARDRIVAGAVERLATMPGTDLAALEAQAARLSSRVGEVATFYLDMIEMSELVVGLSGSATDHVVVRALRHIVEAELAAASAAVDADIAVAAEAEVADAWRRTVTHIRAGRPRAARAAFEEQAQMLQGYLQREAELLTVGELIRTDPETRASELAERMSSMPAPGFLGAPRRARRR
jgi:DNA-binding FadR family transcriptional regulator